MSVAVRDCCEFCLRRRLCSEAVTPDTNDCARSSQRFRPIKGIFVASVVVGLVGLLAPIFHYAEAATLGIVTASLKNGMVGKKYSAGVNARGGKKPYSWSLIDGTLPDGLTLDTAEGRISGMPSQAGKFSLSFQVTDSIGAISDKTLVLTIAANPPSITTKSLRNGKVGKKYLASLKARGGKKPYSWSLIGGPLPPGLTLDTAKGRISGVPTGGGIFNLTFQVQDSLGQTNAKALALNLPGTLTLQVTSRVLSDTDNAYPTGRMVRIDVDASIPTTDIAGGTIRITSASQGYDSGVQDLRFGSIFYEWDTTGLNPATDYVAEVSLVEASGQTASNFLTVGLLPNPPVINKLVSQVDLSFQSLGVPVRIVRTYLLDSDFNGPLGYGWTHNYRMRILETTTNQLDSLGLAPVPGTVQIFNADGTGSFFKPNGDGTYQSPKGDFRTLTELSNGVFRLRGKYGTEFYFSGNGKLFLIKDRNGNLAILVYDATDRLESVIDSSNQATTFSYDGFNRITAITDPAGRSVTYSYDGAGNLAAVTDIGGATTTYSYDANHNLTTITDPTGRNTFFTVDAEDRLASVSGACGENSLDFQYGVPTADKMTVTDAAGNQTVLRYDNNALITQVKDPSGNTTNLAYDTNFNLTTLQDANGGLTTLGYDSRGNVLLTKDAKGNPVDLTYEPTFNRVASLTEAKGNTTSFTYDANGNLTATIYPDGSMETYAYNAVGNLTSKIDRKGQTIGYSDDGAGRLTQKTFPDSTSDTFTYDPAGNLTSATDENGTISFAYDSQDRVTSVTYPGGEVVGYAYDAAGNRTQLTYPNGKVLDYTYDALNRLSQIKEASSVVAQYTYDSLSRVIRRDLRNGTFSTYNYDASSRLLDLINKKSTGTIISRFTYTYDNIGNRLTMTALNGTTQYFYDSISQLTKVIYPTGSTTDYNLDAAGNRASVLTDGVPSTYSSNSLNQYASVNSDIYTYDPNGNMTTKTTVAGTTTYTYDFENRLIQVVTPTEVVSYTYDPFGRRISKTTSAGTTKFFHDGFRVIAEKDSLGAVQATYVHGRWIDEVLVMNRGGIEYVYSQDGLGSVINLTDLSEDVVESYAYDAYGAPSSLHSVENFHLFTGREYGPETGLYFYRARYYSPNLGAFITQDPIGFYGGLNSYS